MKKVSILSASFLLIAFLCINLFKVNAQSDNSQIYRSYYFHETSVDSNIFEQDSIVVYKNSIGAEYPSLALYDDQKFCLFYHVNLETIRSRDENTGEYFERVVRSSDEFTGNYGLLVVELSENDPLDVSLTLNLGGNKQIIYDILEQEDQIILIKEE